VKISKRYDEFTVAYEAVEKTGASVGRVLVCRRKILTLIREDFALWPIRGLNIRTVEEGQVVAKLWSAEVVIDDQKLYPVCFPEVPEGTVAIIQEEASDVAVGSSM
jgi:hypothetical protein